MEYDLEEDLYHRATLVPGSATANSAFIMLPVAVTPNATLENNQWRRGCVLGCLDTNKRISARRQHASVVQHTQLLRRLIQRVWIHCWGADRAGVGAQVGGVGAGGASVNAMHRYEHANVANHQRKPATDSRLTIGWMCASQCTQDG